MYVYFKKYFKSAKLRLLFFCIAPAVLPLLKKFYFLLLELLRLKLNSIPGKNSNDGNQKLQMLFMRIFPLILCWFWPFYVVFSHFGSFLAILSSFLPLWGGQTPVTPVAWSVDHFESILAASKNCVMGFNDLKYLVEYLW